MKTFIVYFILIRVDIRTGKTNDPGKTPMYLGSVVPLKVDFPRGVCLSTQ